MTNNGLCSTGFSGYGEGRGGERGGEEGGYNVVE